MLRIRGSYVSQHMEAQHKRIARLRAAGDPEQLAKDTAGAAAMREAIADLQANPFAVFKFQKPGCSHDRSQQLVAPDATRLVPLPVEVDEAEAGSVRGAFELRSDHAPDGAQEHQGYRREAAGAKPCALREDGARMRSQLVDIEVCLHHETDAALKVSTDGEQASAVWVPKVACEIERTGKTWKLKLPERMAIDKGLV
jgi:hypothetical protein